LNIQKGPRSVKPAEVLALRIGSFYWRVNQSCSHRLDRRLGSLRPLLIVGREFGLSNNFVLNVRGNVIKSFEGINLVQAA